MRATAIPAEELKGRVESFLAALGADLPVSSVLTASDAVESLPDWVARFGLLSHGTRAWFYCEPVSGVLPQPAGQVAMRIPAGRLMIDTFDMNSRECIARESAPGGPLVAGLAFTGNPILLIIRQADRNG